MYQQLFLKDNNHLTKKQTVQKNLKIKYIQYSIDSTVDTVVISLSA